MPSVTRFKTLLHQPLCSDVTQPKRSGIIRKWTTQHPTFGKNPQKLLKRSRLVRTKLRPICWLRLPARSAITPQIPKSPPVSAECLSSKTATFDSAWCRSCGAHKPFAATAIVLRPNLTLRPSIAASSAGALGSGAANSPIRRGQCPCTVQGRISQPPPRVDALWIRNAPPI